jgi:hypothetical protein
VTTARIVAAQRLADIIVERYDVKPPVDVRRLVEEYASVNELTRDIAGVDALLLGLDSDEKEVFLNPVRQGQRRRFTLGHELGHILLAWHQAHELLCVADGEDESEDPDKLLRLPGADSKSREIRAQELEADAFAARTLVPKRFVDSIAHMDMDAMLLALEDADVSIPAGMRALADSLAPGYVFAMLDDRDLVARTWRSGQLRTGVPMVPGLFRGEPVNKKLTTRTLSESGWAYHYNRRVWWGRADLDLPVPEKSSDWKPLLQSICAEASMGDVAVQKALLQTVAGICGALVNDVDEATPQRMAGLLMIRLKRREDLDAFISHPDFNEFVFARAETLYNAVRRRGPRTLSARTN